jgi:predicted short-subunit dehydrogenase-like oxidoreductase (DUF2520 family)
MNEIAIIGAGRLGHALSTALRAARRPVIGPLGRRSDGAGADAVLLCVPDGQIAAAAAHVAGRGDRMLVGHVSGATTLEPLAGHEAFSLHPLMTVPAGAGADVFAGAGAAVAGSTPRALAFAERLARDLGMTPFHVSDEDRAAYHAAASLASNYLVTLEAAAERLLGHDRELLVPLVRATVENWARLGARDALTGPVARGDELTVARQRAAVAERSPELAELFDVLTRATRELAGREAGSEAA